MSPVDLGTVTIRCRNPFEFGQSGFVVTFMEEGTEGASRLYFNRVCQHAVYYMAITRLLDKALNVLRGAAQEMDFPHALATLPEVGPIEIPASEGLPRAPADTQLQQGLVNLLQFAPQPDEPNEKDIRPRPRYRFPE